MGKQYRVRCTELDANGRGVVKFNNTIFAVKGVLPGELISMELVYRAKETGAKMVELLEPSPDRIQPECPLFGSCGGCQLLHMSEQARTRFKQTTCEKLLGGYGKVQPILTAEHPQYYRNKVHAAFAYAPNGSKKTGANGKQAAKGKASGRLGKEKKKIVSGIFEEETHRVVPTVECLIQDRRAEQYLATVRELMERTHTAPYHEDSEQGTLRYVYLRFAKNTGEVLMVLVTGTPEFYSKGTFAAEIKKRHPEIVTLLHNVNSQKNSMVLGKKETILYGKGYIEDELCGCRFRISAESFYQINEEQTARLYQTAIDLAGLDHDKTVLDAYSGIGTISLIAAKSAGRVIGVELNKKAVSDAKINAELNQAENVEFICADAGEYMKKAAQGKERPDVVFLDPPRAGSDEVFLSSLVAMKPAEVIYISCNPETQARDLKYLITHGYHVTDIQPVDMFPGTKHIETVVKLVGAV